MLFHKNTCKTGNNAVKMSQAFQDISRFERFTDLNLYKVAWLDFLGGGYLPSLSINYVGMSKDMAIGVAMAM